MVTDRDYDVTGALTPDATGPYDIAGVHNGENYLRRHDGAYFVWWNGAAFWYITDTLGVVQPNNWIRNAPDITGDYNPAGTALGIATVTEHED